MRLSWRPINLPIAMQLRKNLGSVHTYLDRIERRVRATDSCDAKTVNLLLLSPNDTRDETLNFTWISNL